MEIDAFPPCPEEAICEFGVTYHSDDQIYSESPGMHGFTIHAQMFYGFMPPQE